MMDQIAELENVDNVCRLCLSGDGPKSSVFGTQDSPVSLVSKIQACLSIQISVHDKFSTQICAQCEKSVNHWHNYKETCLRSQVRLQQWLENHLRFTPMVITVKDEPIDLDFDEGNSEVILESTETSDLDVTYATSSLNEMVQNNSIPSLVSEEMADLYSNKNHSTPQVTVKASGKTICSLDKQSLNSLPLKTEAPDHYDTDCAIEIEAVGGSELILNPLAKRRDTVMEADSTQKSTAVVRTTNKKKLKRRSHTHYRGLRSYKQKCQYCQINLHSKHSYAKHMKRFHTQEKPDAPNPPQDQEELIEDIEDELISMENEAPLTQVQENIISQLKTFSCYTCNTNFVDRKTTLNHIRQHMPDLRPYTCVACLTQFPDRSMYKLHCGASFECAMKIALVIPKHGQEKLFSCNMCLRSVQNRKELLNHLARHSDKQYEKLISPMRSPPKLSPMTSVPAKKSVAKKESKKMISLPAPYKNGDPLFNHVCDLCGMIYRHKINMFKHRELCLRLAPEIRTSYRCVHCGMTFLLFKKYHCHLSSEHKKKGLICHLCNAKFFTSREYLAHHETHRKERKLHTVTANNVTTSPSISRPIQDWDMFEARVNSAQPNPQKYSCALCSQDFKTRAELTEHRNIHLKVKIYSCVICRSMFSSAGALEVHMKDHGIEDSNERRSNISCVEYGQLDESLPSVKKMNASVASDPGSRQFLCRHCGKSFTNLANQRRHERNIHNNNRKDNTCSKCSKTFETKKLFSMHIQTEHKENVKNMYPCPQCPKHFVTQSNWKLHLESAHGPKSLIGHTCNLCGKHFIEESSLKIHKTWHIRSKNREKLQAGNLDQKPVITKKQEQLLNQSPDRSPRARKSFPNPPPPKPTGNFQCQVCNDKFNDVAILRKHLWDIHCARNKLEKSLTNNELQCELCTNTFSDKETLKLHMQWHKANPILTDLPKPTFPCEVCGKIYSSKKVLSKHKRLHKATTVTSIKYQTTSKKSTAAQLLCTICRRVFSSNQSLQRHRISFHGDTQIAQSQINTTEKRQLSLGEPKAKRMKLEAEDSKIQVLDTDTNSKKKAVMCHPCKKLFPNMSILYRHKQQVHKQFPTKQTTTVKSLPLQKQTKLEFPPVSVSDDKFACNVCSKSFSALSHLRQHFTIKHKNLKKSELEPVNVKVKPPVRKEPTKYVNSLLVCNLCDRQTYTSEAMSRHMLTTHKTTYDAGINKNFHREVDLNTYVIRGLSDSAIQVCPHCNIKYPNFRALKIHYFRYHEQSD